MGDRHGFLKPCRRRCEAKIDVLQWRLGVTPYILHPSRGTHGSRTRSPDRVRARVPVVPKR